jgi:hypothetical protein
LLLQEFKFAFDADDALVCLAAWTGDSHSECDTGFLYILELGRKPTADPNHIVETHADGSILFAGELHRAVEIHGPLPLDVSTINN